MPELQPSDPDRLGSYEITARLGEGGQGVVYLGTDPAGTQVAVKLLRPDLTEDSTARNRFVREVQAAKKVARFCTAQVLEADVAGDRPYIVSEYVEGPSLYRKVREEGPRDGGELERLAVSTATALVAIHQAGILHRDFKPHNVLLGPDGPRVIDFGIAKALDVTSTVSTQAIGTPAYMAPEQVMGEALSNAVDIFSWAAVIVFAATGKPPFGADTIPAVINRILSQEPDLSGVPAELQGLVRECLAKEPERRPTAQAVLMRLLGHENAVPAYGPGPQGTGPGAAGAMGLAGLSEAAAGRPDGDTPPTRIEPAVSGTSPTAVMAGVADPYGPGTTGPGGGGTTLPPVQGYPPPRSGNRGVLIAAIAAAVVLLGILGLTILLLNSHGSPSSNSTTSTSGPAATTSGTQTSSGPSPTATNTTPQNTGTQSQAPAPTHHSVTPTHTQSSAPPTSSTPTTTAPETTAPGTTAPASGQAGGTQPSG